MESVGAARPMAAPRSSSWPRSKPPSPRVSSSCSSLIVPPRGCQDGSSLSGDAFAINGLDQFMLGARMASVTFDAVSKVYEGEMRAVDELSLEIADGEFVVLVGPS